MGFECTSPCLVTVFVMGAGLNFILIPFEGGRSMDRHEFSRFGLLRTAFLLVVGLLSLEATHDSSR